MCDALTTQSTSSQLPNTKTMGNTVKGHFICFDFRMTFHNTVVFCTLSCLSVRLGFHLLLVVCLFTLSPFIQF